MNNRALSVVDWLVRSRMTGRILRQSLRQVEPHRDILETPPGGSGRPFVTISPQSARELTTYRQTWRCQRADWSQPTIVSPS